jgi:transketolase C-terminal domain/subunit
VAAALRLWGEGGWRPEIFSWPWINRVDPRWFLRLCRRFQAILVLDNHLESGGLGDLFGRLLVRGRNKKPQLHRMAIPSMPPSGENQEVLHALKMDQVSLKKRFLELGNC